MPARNSVRIGIIVVGSLPLLCFPFPMFTLFCSFLEALRSCFHTRTALQLEILALRHQIIVPRGSRRGRVRLNEAGRYLWAAAHVVRLMICAYHRKLGDGHCLARSSAYGRWKSRQGRHGRPKASREVRDLYAEGSRMLGNNFECKKLTLSCKAIMITGTLTFVHEKCGGICGPVASVSLWGRSGVTERFEQRNDGRACRCFFISTWSR